MKRLTHLVLPTFILGLAAASQAAVVYQNDFESGSAAGFAPGPVAQAPTGTRFLGRFSGTSGSGSNLTLTNLPSHAQLVVTFDLYIIQSWDGSGSPGPDRLQFSYDNTPFLDATFANHSGAVQSYSDATPLGGGPFAAMTGADAIGSLGYNNFGYGSDSTYAMGFTLAHAASSVSLDFASFNLQYLDDESWGIDNLVVRAEPVPEPATLAGLAAGVGLFVRRRRAR